MSKKIIRNIILSLIIGIVLEMLVFQFPILKVKLNGSITRDAVYSLGDMLHVNWTEQDGMYISGNDPQLYIETPPMHVASLAVTFRTEPQITSVTLFYTDKNGELKTTQTTPHSDKTIIRLNKDVGATLRIDLGGTEGTCLTDCAVTVNPSTWDISYTRIITVVLLYVCGSLLFRLQRMPDYHLDRVAQKKEEV